MGSGSSIATLARRLEKLENRKPKEELFPQNNIELRGNNLAIQTDESKEILLVGAAGTGKSTACMKKLYDMCLKYPYIRCAIVRKTRASLVETALVTFEQHILGYGHPLLSGANRINRMSYVFPNNSRINVVGMDKADRVLSSDYDFIYVCQAEELSEEDMEALMSRLRNGKMPYQQLLMDCNPQSESHWLYQRHLSGKLKLLNSYHKDNPRFFSLETNDFTAQGKDYLENTLACLSGVRYERLYLGRWVSAEGAVYEFDRKRHVYSHNTPRIVRYIGGIDWGHRDAGAMVVVGEGEDGCLYVVDEMLRTGQTLEFWENQARMYMAKYGDIKFYCDPSIQAHIQAMKIKGIPAFKANNKIQFGVDLVQQRFNKTLLKISSFSSKHEDQKLRDSKMPTTLIEEIEGYVWNESKDAPSDRNNHAVDALRYAVVEFDRPRAEIVPLTSSSVSSFRNRNKGYFPKGKLKDTSRIYKTRV